jgi:hypothetical protein
LMDAQQQVIAKRETCHTVDRPIAVSGRAASGICQGA